MNKYLFSVCAMAFALPCLFAQEARSEGRTIPREGQGRVFESSQRPRNGNVQQEGSEAPLLAGMEGTVVTITAPSGDIFVGKMVNGALRLNLREKNQLQKQMDRAKQQDRVTIEANGVSVVCGKIPWHLICCVLQICDCDGPLLLKVMALMEGTSTRVSFSEGGEALIRVQNGKALMSSSAKEIIRDGLDNREGDLTISIANGDVVINGPVVAFDNCWPLSLSGCLSFLHWLGLI